MHVGAWSGKISRRTWGARAGQGQDTAEGTERVGRDCVGAVVSQSGSCLLRAGVEKVGGRGKRCEKFSPGGEERAGAGGEGAWEGWEGLALTKMQVGRGR